MSEGIDLFSPIRIGACELRNRVVMAPMTRNRAGEGNVPQPMTAEYYAQRASAGLIITEASPISPQGVGYPATPGIHTDAQVEGWKEVTTRVHEKGGCIFIQLWHVGRISHPSLQPDGGLPVAPSAIKPEGDAFTYEGLKPFVMPRALETHEIAGIVSDYAAAARNAMEAGFDGVEVHSANGYLLDQFLRDGTNHRDDEYGGAVENRMRFLREVMTAVCDAIGPEKTAVRISPENSFNTMSDSDAQATFNSVAEMLDAFGLAYQHVLEGDMLTPGENQVNYRQIRDRFHGPYMANCGYDLERAQQAIRQNDADLVSFGIPYIANPDLVERFKAGAALAEADQATFYGGDEKGYTDYPAMDA